MEAKEIQLHAHAQNILEHFSLAFCLQKPQERVDLFTRVYSIRVEWKFAAANIVRAHAHLKFYKSRLFSQAATRGRGSAHFDRHPHYNLQCWVRQESFWPGKY